MLLLLDNYDSFTFNLAQYLGELGAEVVVRRNNEVTLEEIEGMHPSHIVISPGPGRPEDAGISVDAVRTFGPRLPLLGVCLGHQAIGHAFGGRVVRAPHLMHGKPSTVEHDRRGIFKSLSGPFQAGRYHSLVISDEAWPAELEVAARAVDDGLVMAVRHREHPIHGVQFHPESVLTPEGRLMLRAFLEL
jgi:anthranilate synthase/aminodeoxychorismate synthase-like glutamine amidotransferase